MTIKKKYWIGRTAVSPDFGRVFHGRELDVSPDQARRHAKNLSDKKPATKPEEKSKKPKK